MAAKSFFLIISVVLLNSNTISSSELITSSPTPMDTCKTKLDLCSLETGKSHFIGARGAKGLKGDRGDDGPTGPPGIDGSKGSAGIDGRNGVDGPPGVEGDKGSKGPFGVRGAKGKQGAPGLPGPKGPKGNKGVAGANATCGCKTDIVKDFREVDGRRKWGAVNNVAHVTCRDAPDKDKKKKKGTYYIYWGAMPVSCDFEAGTTCVKYNKKTTIKDDNPKKTITYKESKSFWLSEKEVSLEDIYNLHSDALTWLQRQSYTANLTLRYHCKNSTPKNLTLLAWNDMKIGPKSSSSSPFYYTVENDGCSGAKKDEWKYADIVLKSFRAQMIPIIDFFIEVVTNEEQAVRIETVKLCFG